MGIEMDAELDAVHNLFPGPARDAKVGNQSCDWHSKKPMGEKVMDEKSNIRFILSVFLTDLQRLWRALSQSRDKQFQSSLIKDLCEKLRLKMVLL